MSDRFTVLLHSTYDVNSHRIACPHCGAEQGLIYRAAPIDAEAMVSCPCGYDWWDDRIPGETVHDLFLALTGQPTRTSTVLTDGEAHPREACQVCAALKAEVEELGLLASAADGAERADLGARTARTLAAWCGHLADDHLGSCGDEEAR